MRRLSPALLCFFGVCASAAVHADADAQEARFRGCESAGWCRFVIGDVAASTVLRVRPEGVAHAPHDDSTGPAVRNRLNELLSSMIHQNKHIVLKDLRELDDGTYAAVVTVNGIDLAADARLVELLARPVDAAR